MKYSLKQLKKGKCICSSFLTSWSILAENRDSKSGSTKIRCTDTITAVNSGKTKIINK